MIWCVEDDSSIRDIEVYALTSTGFEAKGFEDGDSFWNALQTQQPDLVVLNNLHANYIHLPMLLMYLAKKDIPTVVVLHDCWLYTGKCCFYTSSECEKWKDRCHDCPARKQYNKSSFFDFSKTSSGEVVS